MIIRGKERGFELNVQSHAEIEKLCENEDFNNFTKLFDGKTQGENIQLDMRIACILNKGYEDRKAYEDPNYSPVYLTLEDMQFMKITDVQKLEQELSKVIIAGNETTVEGEPPKAEKATGKKTEEDDKSESN